MENYIWFLRVLQFGNIGQQNGTIINWDESITLFKAKLPSLNKKLINMSFYAI